MTLLDARDLLIKEMEAMIQATSEHVSLIVTHRDAALDVLTESRKALTLAAVNNRKLFEDIDDVLVPKGDALVTDPIIAERDRYKAERDEAVRMLAEVADWMDQGFPVPGAGPVPIQVAVRVLTARMGADYA